MVCTGKSFQYFFFVQFFLLGYCFLKLSLPGFIVQLRSLEDHSPLPNITVGDIGTKMGNGAYNSMDNGFLMFDHVRIPRDQMLMRSSLFAFRV